MNVEQPQSDYVEFIRQFTILHCTCTNYILSYNLVFRLQNDSTANQLTVCYIACFTLLEINVMNACQWAKLKVKHFYQLLWSEN